MAAPNIVSITGLTLKSTATALTSTGATVVIATTAAAGICKTVTSLYAANVDGTNATHITLALNSSGAGGGTSYQIAPTMNLPADSVVAIVTKNAPIHIEEDRCLVATPGSTDDVHIVISYMQSS